MIVSPSIDALGCITFGVNGEVGGEITASTSLSYASDATKKHDCIGCIGGTVTGKIYVSAFLNIHIAFININL